MSQTEDPSFRRPLADGDRPDPRSTSTSGDRGPSSGDRGPTSGDREPTSGQREPTSNEREQFDGPDARRPGQEREPEGGPGLSRVGLAVLLGVLAMAGYSLWTMAASQGGGGPHITYTELVRLVEDDAVERVTLRGDDVSGELRTSRAIVTSEGDTLQSADFQANLPVVQDPDLLPLLREKEVEMDVLAPSGSSWLWTLLGSLLPLFLLFVVWMFVAQRMRGGGQGLLSIGRSGARLYERGKETTTFEDVAGARGAKQELREIIEFLRTPERFRRLGAEIPRGVLLVGPPGTGKTLLARAVAGEADVPFFSITGSDFMEMFVGVGPKRVRDLFESATSAAPSIIFIDELDAIGGRRGAGVWVGGADERERTLNQLLSEMSGFEPFANVIVMAATNRPDVLDPALLRPGRFDRRIAVELPTQADRALILRLHARRIPLEPGVDLESVARGTPGFSGADLKNLLNEAALLAARRNHDQVRGDDVEEARDKVLMGLEREGLALTDREIRFLSFHEAGHAVLAVLLPHTDPLHKVTIVPRGQAMGITQQLPEKERYVYEREYILDRITVMMGGRAAEDLVFGTFTSGAQDDLFQAVSLVRRMVLEWGMSDALGPVVAERPREATYLGEGGPPPQWREYSEDTARRVDAAVEQIVGDCYERARSTLERHRPDLDRVADRLREVEELTGDEVTGLIGAGGKREPRVSADGSATSESVVGAGDSGPR
jgi:cell division protease FtsH